MAEQNNQAERAAPLSEDELWIIQGVLRTAGKVALARRVADVAADRRKQSSLQALSDAGQDIEASGERKLSKAQIDDIVYRCRQGGNDTTYDIVNAAIAYIEGRSAPAAGTVKDAPKLDKAVEREKFIKWGEVFHRNARSYTARDFDHGFLAWLAAKSDAAIEAHNRAGKEQG